MPNPPLGSDSPPTLPPIDKQPVSSVRRPVNAQRPAHKNRRSAWRRWLSPGAAAVLSKRCRTREVIGSPDRPTPISSLLDRRASTQRRSARSPSPLCETEARTDSKGGAVRDRRRALLVAIRGEPEVRPRGPARTRMQGCRRRTLRAGLSEDDKRGVRALRRTAVAGCLRAAQSAATSKRLGLSLSRRSSHRRPHPRRCRKGRVPAAHRLVPSLLLRR